MELQPADLGGGLALEVIHARVATANAGRRGGRLRAALVQRAPVGKPARLGMIDRLILRGSGLSEEAQNKAAEALSMTRTGMVIGSLAPTVGFLPAIFAFASQGNMAGVGVIAAMGLGMSAMVTGLSLSYGRRHVSAPLTEDELANLTVANQGSTLRQDFLRLAREISKQEKISPEAEAGLRDALRSLGDALEQLPFSTTNTASPVELRENAATVRSRADAEPDSVTQASLLRQADALERSAQAAERSALIWKRTIALHAELAAQIESLRLGLTAFYTGDGDVSGLAALSENVRTVAAEAVSVASARAELDAVPVYVSPAAPQAQALTLGG
ncbi:MAG: hypothetical protein H7145_03310 [Akkermansiaceae bacterium]|nr:hypothetical protein [Armatimonadota bacterium]